MAGNIYNRFDVASTHPNAKYSRYSLSSLLQQPLYTQNSELRWFNPPSPPILEHFCPLLPRWTSFCPNGVSFCPEYHPQPCSLLSMYVCKTPQSPPKNTPFPGLNLKVAKWTTVWATWTPTGQKFLKSGQKKIPLNYSCQGVMVWWLAFDRKGTTCKYDYLAYH